MPDPFVSSDAAATVDFARIELQQAVKGNRRQQLEAIRDYIAHELEGNLCNTCRNSRLRTGDQASLIQRLRDVLADLDSLPTGEEENRLDSIRGHLGVSGFGHPNRGPDAEQVLGASDPSEQRRTGSRKPGGGRRPAP